MGHHLEQDKLPSAEQSFTLKGICVLCHNILETSEDDWNIWGLFVFSVYKHIDFSVCVCKFWCRLISHEYRRKGSEILVSNSDI